MLLLWTKVMLQVSLACVITSVYMCILFSSKCFAVHGSTNTINGNYGVKWHNITNPLSWVVICLFVAAICFSRDICVLGQGASLVRVCRLSWNCSLFLTSFEASSDKSLSRRVSPLDGGDRQ